MSAITLSVTFVGADLLTIEGLSGSSTSGRRFGGGCGDEKRYEVRCPRLLRQISTMQTAVVKWHILIYTFFTLQLPVISLLPR